MSAQPDYSQANYLRILRRADWYSRRTFLSDTQAAHYAAVSAELTRRELPKIALDKHNALDTLT